MSPEALVISFLNRKTVTGQTRARAYGDVPEKRPDRFITVERVGGVRGLHMDRPLLAVQAWAGSRAQAMILADQLAALFTSVLPLEKTVASSTVSSLYNFPDPLSRAARYQLTLNLILMNS
ncbi:MAG: hypothetical protein KH427_00870 [Actinomycetaceae bacterium]|nr:hypothetical protein [Actinomycetaceae bacterium]